MPISWEVTLWYYLHCQEIALIFFFSLPTVYIGRQLTRSQLNLLEKNLKVFLGLSISATEEQINHMQCDILYYMIFKKKVELRKNHMLLPETKEKVK